MQRRWVSAPAVWAVAGALPALLGCEQTTVSVVPVSSVEVSPAALEVVQGDEEALSAVPRGGDGQALAGRTVEWSSDNADVASVNGEGRVEGQSPGTTRVHATADGVTGSADVTVLPPRMITVPATTLQLEGVAGDPDPVELEVQVTNGGGGTLNGLGATVLAVDGGSTDWLETTLAGGTAPTSLRVRGHVASLDPGTYQARIALAAPRAVNSPAHIDVTLEVQEPPPVLSLNPVSISLSARAGAREPATQTVTVANTGGGVLGGLNTSIRYTAGGEEGWLTAQLDGTMAPTEMILSALARNLTPGEYAAVVRVSSPVALNGYAEVNVSFTVGGNDLALSGIGSFSTARVGVP